VLQNEYTTWVLKDKHAKAYAILQEKPSKLIARNLGLPGPPEESARCLACHATPAPADRRGRTFALSDGVACEACHGPAEDWLGPHTTRGWTHAQSVAAGMNDTKSLLVRARTCLGCHLGDDARRVDHEMIAAGHPDLVFELDTWSVTQPAHWSEPQDAGPWLGVRQWAVGQAAALAESMKLLSRRAPDRAWPEFADYECFACHHGLVRNSERVVRGYDAAPGTPRWNGARYVVLRRLVARLDPATVKSLDTDLGALEAALRDPRKGQEEARAAAERVAATAEPLAARLASPATAIDGELVAGVLSDLARDADAVADAGYRAAEQAALAVDALYRPYLRNVKRGDPRAAGKVVDRLFQTIQDPNRFQRAEFSAALRAVGEGVAAR
jgi:hypothetical protein